MSQKDFRRVTSLEHIPRMSILNLSYKFIFNVLFLILFNQMCAWNTEELAVL